MLIWRGYSRLIGDDEGGKAPAIVTHRTAMTHLPQEYRGRVVGSPGRNVLGEFTNMLDEVNWIVEI